MFLFFGVSGPPRCLVPLGGLDLEMICSRHPHVQHGDVDGKALRGAKRRSIGNGIAKGRSVGNRLAQIPALHLPKGRRCCRRGCCTSPPRRHGFAGGRQAELLDSRNKLNCRMERARRSGWGLPLRTSEFLLTYQVLEILGSGQTRI